MTQLLETASLKFYFGVLSCAIKIRYRCSLQGRDFKVKSGADPGFGQGGAPGPEAESCQCSEAESRE